ncbi:MAG: hypothetical protein ABR861_04355 [Terriglobales bacterium]
MNKETVDQMIAVLGALFHHSREHAAKFKALDRIAQEHPEIFSDYQNYVYEIEIDPVFQKSHDHTVEAVDRLRVGLLQDHV